MNLGESKIEKGTCDYAKKKGCLAIKLSSPSSRGWPDRIFHTIEGDTFYIEFKKKGKKLRKLQAHRANEILAHNIKVYTVDTLEGGKNIVDLHTLGT